MKKLAVSIVLFAACVGAADFWQSKPFADWNDKDVKKMLESSPWSKETSIAVGGSATAQGGGSGKRGGRTPGSMGEASNGSENMPGGGMDEAKGGARASAGGAEGVNVATASFIVRWQSALPVKEALARIKYGSEASTSKEAKALIETAEPNYIIVVSGLSRTYFSDAAGSQKQDIINNTELLIRGKDPIKAVDFMMQPNGRVVDAYFAFPKSSAFSVDDKEIEFSAKIRTVMVKQRFQLKNMVVNGKLEL